MRAHLVKTNELKNITILQELNGIFLLFYNPINFFTRKKLWSFTVINTIIYIWVYEYTNTDSDQSELSLFFYSKWNCGCYEKLFTQVASLSLRKLRRNTLVGFFSVRRDTLDSRLHWLPKVAVEERNSRHKQLYL